MTVASKIKSLVRDQVTVGQALPELSHDITATTVVLGALASRDWRPMHHDKDFAINRNGVRNIFINTPNNAAWFERYLTDWTGPRGRLGRIKFKMKKPVFPGDRMVMSGTVRGVSTDDVGCVWVDVDLAMSVDGEVTTACEARIAIPRDEADNPWTRRGEQWKP